MHFKILAPFTLLLCVIARPTLPNAKDHAATFEQNLEKVMVPIMLQAEAMLQNTIFTGKRSFDIDANFADEHIVNTTSQSEELILEEIKMQFEEAGYTVKYIKDTGSSDKDTIFLRIGFLPYSSYPAERQGLEP
jgi:hypothetical protein